MLLILFLAAVMEVAFLANSRYRSEMGVELEVQQGDITNARRYCNPVSHRVLDTIYADDTAHWWLTPTPACKRLYSGLQRWLSILDC